MFLNQGSFPERLVQHSVPEKQSRTVYAMSLGDLSDGFQRSVMIYVRNPAGMITTVSNNVNYAVGVDGSSSFGLP